MKISGIYKIINKINGKYYIGSSKDIKKRWSYHTQDLNKNTHNNIHLQKSWNKYGQDNFEFVVVEEVVLEKLLIVEQKYLDKLTLEKDKCYNLSFIAGKVEMTDEIRKRLSLLNKGKNHPQYGTHKTEETKQKLRDKRKDYIFSDETKRKISESVMGTNNGFYGKQHSIENRNKSKERCITLFKNKRNHPRFDFTIYTFFNKNTKEKFVGNRYDFYIKYNINDGRVCDLIKGRVKSILKKSWVLIHQ